MNHEQVDWYFPYFHHLNRHLLDLQHMHSNLMGLIHLNRDLHNLGSNLSSNLTDLPLFHILELLASASELEQVGLD